MYDEMEELKKKLKFKKMRIEGAMLPNTDMLDLRYLLGQYDLINELEKTILEIQLYEGPTE